jgi:ribonuclease P protein component
VDQELKIERMRKRPEFLLAAQARFRAQGAVVVQRRDRADGDPAIHSGFTATKKVGGAVVRNRCKRRMRQAARLLLPQYGLPGSDYVFVARGGTATRPWERLLDDVKSALIRLAADPDTAPAPSAAASDPSRSG